MPIGSSMCIPFNVSNQSDAPVECTFEKLKSEFTIVGDKQHVRLESDQTRQLQLEYRPTMVSSQEFYLPLTMNKIRTDLRPESTSSARSTWHKMTPSRLVVAAAAQRSLEITPSNHTLVMKASEMSSHFEITNLTDKPIQAIESVQSMKHGEVVVVK